MSEETFPAGLYTALAKAQGAMSNAVKDTANPAFKSKFASLAAVRDIAITALSEQGIACIQMPGRDDKGRVTIQTMLLHESGHLDCGTLTTEVTVRGGNDAQAVGSALTYLRRYALAAIAGVAQEDDDGNASGPMGGRQGSRPSPQRNKTAWSQDEVGGLLTRAFGEATEGEPPPEQAQAFVYEVTKMDIPTMMASPTARAAIGVALKEKR